jgi:hypothetical protein
VSIPLGRLITPADSPAARLFSPPQYRGNRDSTQAKIPDSVYTLMRDGVEYVRQSEQEYEEQHRQRMEKQLRRRAKELGYEVRKIEPPPGAESSAADAPTLVT